MSREVGSNKRGSGIACSSAHVKIYRFFSTLLMTLMTRLQSIGSAAGIVLLLASFACQVAFAAESKRVMLLHSFGQEFKPWKEIAESIRVELERQSPWPLDITDHSLISARSSDESAEAPFVEYLRALFGKQPLDLVVSVGAPAASFVQRHRKQVFHSTPMILTAVDQRRVQYSTLTENDTVDAIYNDHRALWESILQVLPDTKTLAVAIGNSPSEKMWLADLREAAKSFEGRLVFIWYNNLSFEDMLKHAAALPAHSAIYWSQMIVDAADVVHNGEMALTRLHAVANAPIFSYNDTFFGGETVGGPMQAVAENGKRAASIAIRILGGEKPADIKLPPLGFATPKYDWRQMQRWGITERRLPPGSEIYFRDPTAWERYRPQVLAICTALLVQASLIGWLIYEHRRRHLAEVLARNSMAELTHMNRVATAGELSASIAHEINQPLTGIVTRASAARRWLAAERLDIDKARAALDQIEAAGHRASDIITNVRSMFRKDTQEKTQVDINKLIWSVLGLVYIDLRKYQIDLESGLDDQLPPVLGNQVQLQQVILNLVMNAIDSMRSVQPRVLSVKSKLNGPDSVQVSIEDTGIGINPSDLNQIFKPLFTTKEHGMGMGLSICRSIIEIHNGRISAFPGANRGSIFQFELPTNASKS
jgi:signal transduction histidine kinase/ABC-type uncharacterized transport system substrate-binding protein